MRRYRLSRSLILLLFLALVGSAASMGAQSPPVPSSDPVLRFAIADFDGDLRPDLAKIEYGSARSDRADYSIELQLTSVGRKSIQFVAPAGGLLIEARDVNDDQAVDLVLVTVRFRQPVGIFLNDGHGGFSWAEPSAFPEAFKESKANWNSATNLATEIVDATPQRGEGICAIENVSQCKRSPSALTPPTSSSFPVNPCFLSRLGRAPPSEFLYL